MIPGYRKQRIVKISDRDNSNITTKNQVIDLIKSHQMSDEFYEIEPAEVIKVWLDENQPGFPTKEAEDEDGSIVTTPDYSAIGACVISLRKNQNSSEYLETLAYPLSQHIVQYPLKGEIVNVAMYEDKIFYSNPLNLDGKVGENRLAGRVGDGYIFKSRVSLNRKVYPEQGDLLIQGRFGQSIRMGSDSKYIKPNLKISVGQGYDEDLNDNKDADPNYPHVENINNDEACIWLTTNEHVPVAMKRGISSDKTKSSQGSKDESNLTSLITLNADGIIFNSKKNRISMFAQTKVNISAVDEINLETAAGKINLLDPNSENPLVMGNQLQKFLNEFVKAVEDHEQRFMNFLKPLISESKMAAYNKIMSDFQQSISEIRNQVNVGDENKAPFLSNRAFIGVNSSFDLDLDNMWDSYEWDELEDVADAGYDVETISDPGGTRG